jgi:cytochrome o ubiquinol oxidase subunit 1
MARRMQHYDNPAWHPWLLVAALGALIIFAGIACQAVQLFVSIRTREQRRDLTGDPWNGRTLEWSTASPPPAWNFALRSVVSERDAFWARKQRALAQPPEPPREADYAPIEMPRNSPVGFVTAFFAVVGGFAMIWHIWWLAAFGVLGAFAATLFFAFRDKVEDEIPSDRLARFDRIHPAGVAA